MKITRAQLKEIIKEEIERSLEEDEGAEGGLYDIYPKSSPPAPENPELSELWSDLSELLAKWAGRDGFPGNAVWDAQQEYVSDLEGVMRVFKQNAKDRMEDDEPSTEPDRYEREERAIRRAGPKGRIPFDPSLYDED